MKLSGAQLNKFTVKKLKEGVREKRLKKWQKCLKNVWAVINNSNAFSKNLAANIKLCKAQISKLIYSGFLGAFLVD